MATNFGTRIAITGFVWTIVTMQLVMGLSQQPTKCRYCRYPATKGCCCGNHFCLCIYIWVYIGVIWQIWLNCPCAAAMRPYVKLLWPLVFLIYLLPYLSFPLRISLLRFQAGRHKRRPYLLLSSLSLFWVVVFLCSWCVVSLHWSKFSYLQKCIYAME